MHYSYVMLFSYWSNSFPDMQRSIFRGGMGQPSFSRENCENQGNLSANRKEQN
jgi:hypothetical protein